MMSCCNSEKQSVFGSVKYALLLLSLLLLCFRSKQGPISSKDLSAKERLDRPAVVSFQHHPGTQLPEAQEIIDGNNDLDESLAATGRNIALLNLTQNRLKEDISDKTLGAQVDSSIVRLRRRKYDHRWVIRGIRC